MPFERITEKGRIVERFNVLLEQFEYYNQSVFPEIIFNDEELIVLSNRRYLFDIKRGNRLLLEHVILPDILEPFNSKLKSVGSSVENRDAANDHDPNFKAQEDHHTEKLEKLSELQVAMMDKIVRSELKKKSKQERAIILLYFFKHKKEYNIHKTLGISRQRINRTIRNLRSIIKNNVPRDLEGFEEKSRGM